MVHVDDDPAGQGSNIFVYTDWILYWNEDMGEGVYTDDAIIEWDSEFYPYIIDSTNISPLVDTIGWCPDLNGNGLWDFVDVAAGEYPFGMYYTSLSSFASIGIDNSDNLYVAYSTIMEGDDYMFYNAEPNAQQYRHIWITAKDNTTGLWTEPICTSDNDGQNAECVFPTVAKNVDAMYASGVNGT